MPIHPDLRRRDAIDRYAAMPLILAVAVWLLVVVVVLYRDARGRLSGPAVGILALLSTVALLVLVAAVMAWRRRHWYERLTALLEGQPVRMRVTFSSGPPRAFRVALQSPAGTAPYIESLVAAPRFDVTPLHQTVVDVHLDPEPDGPFWRRRWG